MTFTTTFTTITALATDHGHSYLLVGLSSNVPGASVADGSSWSALVESLSGPLAIRLAAWLVLGCVIGLCVSFIVRSLRRRWALVGGVVSGLLAAGVFFMAAQPLGEMAGHLLAAGILGLTMALLILRARRRTGVADEMGTEAMGQAASVPAHEAAEKFASGPDPEPEQASAAQSSSSSTPAPDPEPVPADEAALEPEDEMQAEDEEEDSAPTPESQPAPTNEAKSAAAPESPPAPAPAIKPAAALPRSKAKPLATKKQSTLGSPMKAKPKKAKPSSGSDWMQDHT